MSQRSSVAIQVQNATVEIQNSRGAWVDVPGISGLSESGGAAPTETVETWQNTITHTGNVQPPSISISIAGYVPVHPTYKIIDDARRDNKFVTFRYALAETEVRPVTASGNTAAIATSGLVTLAGSDNNDFTVEEIGRGMALKMGNKYYVITAISDTGMVTVVDGDDLEAPDAQVPAAVYSIVTPPMRRPAFSARIMNAFNTDAGATGAVSTTIEIQPLGVLSAWEIVS